MKATAMHHRAFLRPGSSRKFFSDGNSLHLASVMSLVVFVILLLFMTMPTVDGGRTHANLPKVLHPASLPGATREDAVKVFTLRDGVVYLGVERVNPADLAERIKKRLQDPAIEHKVYIVADLHAGWGTVQPLFEDVHDAGILRVCFLADERRFH